MKKSLLLIIFFVGYFTLFNSPQGWSQKHFAQKGGGSGTDIGYAVCTDLNNNVYSTGTFFKTATFGNLPIIAVNNGFDAYFTKYNDEGVVQWVKNAGGATNTEGHAACTDKWGNIYFTGFFKNSATFGTTVLSSNGLEDIFICKLDSNGNFLWAKKLGGPTSDYAGGIAVDSIGDVFITGYFTDSIVTGVQTYHSHGYKDVLVAMFDSAGTLNWISPGGSVKDDEGKAITIDTLGNIFVTGTVGDSALFMNDTLFSHGAKDIFVNAYDPTGTVAWVRNAGGPNDDFGSAIVLDTSGNIHVAGTFFASGVIYFNPIAFSGAGDKDIFHAVYDKSGNVLNVDHDGGPSPEEVVGCVVDLAGNVYITGTFSTSVGLGGNIFPGYGSQDAFVVKYDASAIYLMSKIYGSYSDDQAHGITIDNNGNCLTTGSFFANGHFGNTSLTSFYTDAYVVSVNDVIVDPPGISVSNFHTGNSSLASNNIKDIVIDSQNRVYVATADSGVFRYDGLAWVSINCPLNEITSLFIDSVDNVWISTLNDGLLKYDGVNYTLYNSSSGIGTDSITAVTGFSGGPIWIGTNDNGCVRYTGTNYTVFDTSNGLPDNRITTMNCDSAHHYWMGTMSGGLATFFNSVFSHFDTINSLIPSNQINGACIDATNSLVWIATPKGVASFDGTNWVQYDASTYMNDVYVMDSTWVAATQKKGTTVNSGTVQQRVANTSNALFENDITSIIIDPSGDTYWVGTLSNGVYRLVDTVTIINSIKPVSNDLFNMITYPNPASEDIFVNYSLPAKTDVRITIIDLTGRELKVIEKPNQVPGKHMEKISLQNLRSGIYNVKISSNLGDSVRRIIRID